MATVQARTATVITPAPMGSSEVSASPGRKSSAAPAKPISVPKRVTRLTRLRPGPSRSSVTNQSGKVAHKRAVIPDVTRCSAQVTRPLARVIINTPSTAAPSHWAAVNRTRRCRGVARTKMEPAMMNRIPAIRNGGKESRPYRMARKVVPQMRYMAPNPPMTATDLLSNTYATLEPEKANPASDCYR